MPLRLRAEALEVHACVAACGEVGEESTHGREYYAIAVAATEAIVHLQWTTRREKRERRKDTGLGYAC